MLGNLFSAIWKVITKRPLDVLAAIYALALSNMIKDFEWMPLIIAVIWAGAFFLAVRVLYYIAVEAGYTKFTEAYTTKDIMKMAVLIAVGGIIKGYWGQIRLLGEGILGQYSGFFVSWMFYLWGILACYLVRKPFCGTISMVLGGVIEILVGNPFGLPVLLFNFMEGLGPDIVYGGIFKYRRHNLWIAILSGFVTSLIGLWYGWLYFGFAQQEFGAFVLYLGVTFAGGILSGVIASIVIALLNAVGVKPSTEVKVETA